MDTVAPCLQPAELYCRGEELVPNELSPLHAKVLRYLGEDLSLKLDMSIPREESQFFMETWADLAPLEMEPSKSPPLELKTIRLPSRGGDSTDCDDCRESVVVQEQQDLAQAGRLTGGLQGIEASETLRNPFEVSCVFNCTQEDQPIELRTLRRFDGQSSRSPSNLPPASLPPLMTQTLRGCFPPIGGLGSSGAIATELRTLRREEGLDLPAAPPLPAPATAEKEVPKEVPTQLDEELAVLESVTSLPRSMRTSLATETIPLDSVQVTPGAEAGAGEAVAAWESPAVVPEAEFSRSIDKLQGETVEDQNPLSCGAQDRNEVPTDRCEEGTQHLQETVLLEGREQGGGCQEASPANSAVPSLPGYQAAAAEKPATPAAPAPPVLTAEDEAVTGLRRRGGVEVVIDSPVSARPPSGASAEPPLSGRRPPKAVRAATPVGTTEENDKLICRGQKAGTPVRRRHSAHKAVPHAVEPRRSSSLMGRRPGSVGMQSNRKLVRNALEHCLKGDANREQREQVLKSFDEELVEYERFILLFRSIHTGRHDLRALYGFSEGTWTRLLQLLPSPASLEERMVTQCLRYDSGGKEFKEVPASQETLSVADAVFLYPQYLQKSRGLL